MYDWQHWSLVLGAALALNISPGPDALFILSRTLAHGRRVGLACSLGVCTGALVHVCAAAVGVSALLATSALAFAVVKWIGAAYLLYLGVRTVLFAHREALLDDTVTSIHLTFGTAFRQGVAVDVLNPKVAVFFMAFLPQFIVPELGHFPGQLVFNGLTVIAVGLAWSCLLVLVAGGLTGVLQQRPAVGVWVRRAVGGVLVGLGIRLALLERA